MSPTAKAIAYGVVSLAAFIIFAVGLNNALNGAPGGYHSKSDAPTLGDALRAWLGEHLPRWWDWPLVQWWYMQQYRRADREAFAAEMEELRERAAAASAPGEGTVPSTPGAVPLEVRVTASDGFPAVGIRPGKQPWPTAGQPRIPDVIA